MTRTRLEVLAETEVRTLLPRGAAAPPPIDPSVRRLAADVSETLAALGVAAEALRDAGDSVPAARVADVLAAIGRHATQFDERVARLTPHAPVSMADVASEVTDAVETLATRWERLVPTRRSAVIDRLLRRRAELDAVLVAVGRATAADQPASAATEVSAPRSRSTHASKGGAAAAWDAWTEQPSTESRDQFLRLSQSWIEGTGAQLARDNHSGTSLRENSAEVTARLEHHLSLLAAAGSVPYMDALATARRAVIEELHRPAP